MADVSVNDVYVAMDWLAAGQDAIEAKLARRYLATEAHPQRMALSTYRLCGRPVAVPVLPAPEPGTFRYPLSA